MSATTFLSRIFLSLIFLFQTNTKGKKKKTKKKKKSKERLKKTTTKKKTKETRSNFFLLAIISLPASSQILVIFTATLRIISFCKLKKLRVLWWKFFPEFCLFDLLLSSSFLCFFSPSFFWIAHSVLLPVFSVSVIVGFVDRLFVCVCVCVCVFSCFFFSFFCTEVEAAFCRSCSGEVSGRFQRSESGLERSFDEHGVATFLRFFVRVAMASELPAQLTGIETEVQNIFKSLSYVVILPLSVCLSLMRSVEPSLLM